MHLPRLPAQPHLTYCTNIHAGESWPDIRDSLREFVPPIRDALTQGAPMGIGLRLSGQAADTLVQPEHLQAFQAQLRELNAYVFTVNAFPYGRFHGTQVKQDVYQPDWRHPERLRYTQVCADILAALLPEGVNGRRSKPSSRSIRYCDQEIPLPNSPSLTTSMPAAASPSRTRCQHQGPCQAP